VCRDYHPPSSHDIPLALNVTLLANSPNMAPLSVLKSKASAEPPMMLSISMFLAVRDAIASVRADAGVTGWFDLPTPASTTAIQIACGVKPQSLTI
jgi:xanthine dehydrogenase molybdopterin-binding subunit B